MVKRTSFEAPHYAVLHQMMSLKLMAIYWYLYVTGVEYAVIFSENPKINCNPVVA